jgi:hypothetical protein
VAGAGSLLERESSEDGVHADRISPIHAKKGARFSIQHLLEEFAVIQRPHSSTQSSWRSKTQSASRNPLIGRGEPAAGSPSN